MSKLDHLPSIDLIKRGKVYELSYHKAIATHSFFKYPARFIPEIPNWAIRNFTKEDDKVLDCFAGSGTSLVEASIMKRDPYGIDTDPLSNLLCRVKTRHISKKESEDLIQILEKILNTPSKPSIPELENLDHWFTKTNIKKLGQIKANINLLCSRNTKYREFLLAAFASIIRECSNADLQSPKPYVSKSYPREATDPKKAFYKKVLSLLEVFNQPRFLTKLAKISGTDALKDNKKLHNKFNLVVSSPPYINAFDYVRVLRLENIWLDLLLEKDLNSHRKSQVGSESIKAKFYNSELPITGIKKLDTSAKKILSVDRKRAHVVVQYFKQMNRNIELMHKFLKHKSHYICVVGNSDIAGIEVDVAKILMQIGMRNKFEIENHFSYLVKNPYLRIPRNGKGGLIKMDHVLVMKKNEE